MKRLNKVAKGESLLRHLIETESFCDLRFVVVRESIRIISFLTSTLVSSNLSIYIAIRRAITVIVRQIALLLSWFLDISLLAAGFFIIHL